MSLMSTTGRRAFSPSGHGVLRRSRPSSCLRGYSPTPEHTWAFMPAGLSSTSGRAPGSGSLAWSCRGLTPTTRVCDAPIYSSALGIRHVRCFLSVTPRRNIEGREQGPPGKTRGRIRKVLGSLPSAQVHENIYTIPNLLTASRLIATPFIGYCILHDHHAWALGLFAYAGVTDLLDGWIARKWNQGTVVGTVIDPMADKTLMTVLTIALAMKGALPLWLAGIILGRDVGLAISAIYFRWISLPPPKTFTRYWDFSLPSAEVHPTTISKYNTFLQMALMGVTTMAPVLPLDISQPLTIMQYIVATTTVWSGASYIYSKDAVKILSHSEINDKQKGTKQKQTLPGHDDAGKKDA